MELVKNIKRNIILLVFVTTSVLIIILKDNFQEILTNLLLMKKTFILLAIIMFALHIILKSYVVYKCVDNKNKLSLKESIKHNLITQFFNGITPFSTGGQPMEIYMLCNHNISLAEATSITIQNFIFYQIALVIYGLIAIICNGIFNFFPQAQTLSNLVFFGFSINIFVMIALFIVITCKRLTQKIINTIIIILYKLKLIKDQKTTQEKWQQKLTNFHTSTKKLNKKRGLFVLGILANLLSLTFFYVIPLFIIYGLGDLESLNILNTIIASAYIYIIGSFVPIPGASGGIEYGFIKFFGNFLKPVVLNTMLLVWRSITYYIPIILGAILFMFEKKGEVK